MIAPRFLADAASTLLGTTRWNLSAQDLRAVEAALSGGADQDSVPPLQVSAPWLGQLSWWTLTEAARSHEPDRQSAVERRVLSSFAAMAALRVPTLAVTVGADEAGSGGVCIGFPPAGDHDPVAAQWLADQAPDLLWEALPQGGAPAGWSAVSDPSALDIGLRCRPVPLRAVNPVAAPPARSPALSRLLGLPASHWCVVFLLYPADHTAVLTLRATVMDAALRAGEHIQQSQALTETSSVTSDSPVGRSVADHLRAWSALLEDASTEGAWTVQTFVRARGEAAAATAVAAVSAVLAADDQDAGRRQRWVTVPSTDSRAAVQAPDASLLSSRDLSQILSPPMEPVGRVQVRRPLPGGRRVTAHRRPITLGHWLGTSLEAAIDVDDLSGHAFISGITGSGKSTTSRRVLVQLWNDHDVPFLVIDPAKADYEEVAERLRGGLTVVSGADLKLNALAPWPGRPVRRHIAAVSSAFRASFGLPIPTPYVASLLLETLATAAENGDEVNLHDAAAALDPLVAQLGYHGELESNIRASLGLRLRLLLEPTRADRVAGGGPPAPWLVERPTLIRLNDIGDDDERSFIAALLVLWIGDAARSRGERSSVEHVTVVEEAHRLVPEPQGSSPETGDAASAAAALMTQLLAEIRAYGEAIIIVDQSPAAVAREVIRNTTLKIAHRIVDTSDQATLGGALGLPEDEHALLGSLAVGRCLVSSRDLLTPQPVQIEPMNLDGPFGTVGLDPGVRASFVAGVACHLADDAQGHHRAEAAGARCEQAVAVWFADGGGLSLRSSLGPAAADVGATFACAVSVGVRRHVASLLRVGHLTATAAADLRHELMTAALSGSQAPGHPGRGIKGPYDGCEDCPEPCVVRAAVAGGRWPVLDRARSAVARASGASEAAAIVNAAAHDTDNEFTPRSSTQTGRALGWCVGVHALKDSGLARAVFDAAAEARR